MNTGINLLIAATWLIFITLLTYLKLTNSSFTLYLGLGIFYNGCALHQTKKIVQKHYGKRISI